MVQAPFHRLCRTVAAAALVLLAGACATVPEEGPDYAEVNDPLEVPNRMIFAANEAADVLVLKPAAEVYVAIVPDPIREAVNNVLVNLLTPLYVGHNLLQGDVDGALETLSRSMTNTILGLGGAIDIAGMNGLEPDAEDLGQTLAVWGVGEGPYLVLPILGPSNLRDAVGFAGDFFADPVSILGDAADVELALRARTAAYGLDQRSQALGEMESLKRNSLDYYATLRSLYRQNRRALIRDGDPVEELDFPDYTLAPDPSEP